MVFFIICKHVYSAWINARQNETIKVMILSDADDMSVFLAFPNKKSQEKIVDRNYGRQLFVFFFGGGSVKSENIYRKMMQSP